MLIIIGFRANVYRSETLQQYRDEETFQFVL